MADARKKPVHRVVLVNAGRLYEIVRIDEVARRGTAKITALPGAGERPRTPPSTLVVPRSKKDR